MLGSLFKAIDISASGLYAQRTRMNVISENLANIETTRTDEGEAYRRKIAMLKSGMPDEEGFRNLLIQNQLQLEQTNKEHKPDEPFKEKKADEDRGVRVSEIVEDPSPFKMKYDPYHPDADENGYVALPNVDIVMEMTELINATRSFEANVTAIDSSKDMIRKALKI